MDYDKIVEAYELLENTSSRLKKVEHVSKLFEQTPENLLQKVVMLAQGMVFPAWSDKDLGIANQLVVKTISQTTGFSEAKVLEKFKEIGDFGLIIEELVEKKKQMTLVKRKLTIEKVFENLEKIGSIEGKGSIDKKLAMVSELISFASPKEAKYIIRTTLGTLRIGVAEGVIRDSIVKTFFSEILWDSKKIDQDLNGKNILIEKGYKLGGIEDIEKNNKITEKTLEEIENIDISKVKSKIDIVIINEKSGARLKKEITNLVEMAWFLRPDYGEIAIISKTLGIGGLKNVELVVGKPYQVILSEKSPSLEKAINSYDRVAMEWKYDGARLSIHKKGDRVWLFTRRLEDVTKQFPEVVEWVKKGLKSDDIIVEGEMIGFSNNKPMPFQFLSQRIKRKYDIEKIAKDIPVQVNLFDIVYVNGKGLFNTKLSDRWEILKKTFNPIKNKWRLAEHIETKDLAKAKEFYKNALNAMQEGLIVKNMDAYYQPGRRVSGGWLKVKPTMENLDLVITGATWGTGKRTGWFGSFMLGCRDDNGNFLDCGMIGTGIKEKEGSEGVTFKELTELLKDNIVKEEGNEITLKPKVVVEVAYEEIQVSPNYSSGYALRFPRVLRIRQDKSAGQTDSLERLKTLFTIQKGRGN